MSQWARTAFGATTCLAITASLASAQQPVPPPIAVSGVVYAQYLYQLKDTASHLNNFDVTRAYVNVIGRFSGGLGTRVTADIYRNADNSLAYRLKYAYFGYTPPRSALTFKLGEIHTPWLDWEEALWDYRMQGQMALERGGYLSSSDFGAGVDGSWNHDIVNLQVGVYNGENYNKAPGDKRKDVMGRASVRALASDDASRVGGLRLTAYGQSGKPTGGGIRQRAIGMASYKSRMITLAAEYARTWDRADAPVAPALPDAATITGQVLSVFGVVNIPTTRAALIGRVDVTDPDRTVAGNRQTRFIAGASYQLNKNLRLLADVDNVDFEAASVIAPAVYAARTQGLFQAQFTF